jgi:3-phenylpropionate/cinnamic acid dioxygenase small subunit
MGLILGRAESLDESTLRGIEQFLYREAGLLDDKSWEDWLALYTEDCFYWVPSTMGQADPINTISLFAENRMMMEMRIIRVSHPRAFSQEFPTRTSHLVGNVMIDPDDGSGHDGGTNPRADVVVRSSLHVLEYRKEDQRMFGGTVRHWLRRDGTDWKIALKRIDLINCDAPMETVQLFL